MSFYLDYRPQLFSELDNEQVRSTLVSFLGKPIDKLPHAFFLTGSKGTGKTTTARLLAKLFNCISPKKDGSPCGVCDQCSAIASGRSMDVIEIDAASNTGVDNIRELRQNIILAPSGSRKKVYIIDEVHMLSTGAFNALLKTLEEPPKHAIFILATTDPQKVPDTIQSRCVSLVFTKPSNDEIRNALTRVIKSEKLNISPNALDELIRHSDGSFRDAVKLLEQVSFQKGDISEDIVRSVLNLGEQVARREFIKHLNTRDAKICLETIQSLVANGIDLKTFTFQVLSDLEEQLFLTVERTGSWDILDLKDLIRRFNQAYGEFRLSAIPSLPLELAIVEYCYTMNQHSTSGTNVSSLPSGKTVQSVSTESIKPPDVKRKEARGSAHTAETATPKNIGQKTETTSMSDAVSQSLTLITNEKLKNHWTDIIAEMKPFNHMVSGVLRSCKPVGIEGDTVTIEAMSAFHQGKLKEPQVMMKLSDVMKKLFGERPRIVIELSER